MAVKRLLCIVGGMNAGGAETFLMKIYRRLDKTKYQMDFAVAVKEEGYYDHEIKTLGGRIFHITPKSEGPVKNFNSIRRIVKENGYKSVLRVSQHSLSALELLAAWFGGAKQRIYRSSNSNTTSERKLALTHKLCSFMPKCFANIRIAPSTEAAEFMFGKGCIQSGKATLLNNAIDIEIFRFWEEERKALRQQFNCENDLVIGHVGRFDAQKNHGFLLEVFACILKKQPHSKLLLIGQGSLEQAIRQKAQELDLLDHVIFTGVRSDIPQILSAMDVFVFPSLYEGMPNTVIEAQATGLPCIIADTITREADITGLVQYLALSDGPKTWAEAALEAAKQPRRNTRKDFIENRYDIQSTVENFVKLCFDN